jgi:hypothetical protein
MALGFYFGAKADIAILGNIVGRVSSDLLEKM